MPRCKFCNQLNSAKDSFQDPEYKSNQYCSEEHWRLHLNSKRQKQTIVTKETKPQKPKSDRVKLTDYIQSIWSVEPNWQWLGKQIESLSKETGLSYNDMRMVIKYCVDYKGIEPDANYGLQQFIPRYTQEAKEFAENILEIRELAKDINEEDEYNIVSPKARRGYIKEDLGFGDGGGE